MTDATTTKSKTRRSRSAASESGTKVPGQAAPKATVSKPAEAAPKRRTKAFMVEGLLARKKGATLGAMCEATGWQAHTCRAFLTGLRKKGKEVARDKAVAGKAIYRLVETKKPGAAG